MGVAEDKARIEGAKTDIAASIAAKGVMVPAGTKLDGFAALIDGITAGGTADLGSLVQVTLKLNSLEADDGLSNLTKGESFTPPAVTLERSIA